MVDPKTRQVAERFRLGLAARATPAELKLRDILIDMKIPFVFQKIFYMPPTFMICDFYLPKSKLAIELNGMQHYVNPAQVEKDQDKKEWLSRRGIRTWGIVNGVVYDQDIKKFITRNLVKQTKL